MRIIGSATEFWRVRLTRLSAEDVDFEWHDDILYREPRAAAPDEREEWRVEALRIDAPGSGAGITLAVFAERDEAEAYLRRVDDDLAGMTKTQFETSYLDAGAPRD